MAVHRITVMMHFRILTDLDQIHGKGLCGNGLCGNAMVGAEGVRLSYCVGGEFTKVALY